MLNLHKYCKAFSKLKCLSILNKIGGYHNKRTLPQMVNKVENVEVLLLNILEK